MSKGGRPLTRDACCGGPRPCPWISCRYHLALDVIQTGTNRGRIRALRGGDLQRAIISAERATTIARLSVGPSDPDPAVGRALVVDELFEQAADALVDRLTTMSDTCALDVADRGGANLAAIGAIYGLSRERVRQLEYAALARYADRYARAVGTRNLPRCPRCRRFCPPEYLAEGAPHCALCVRSTQNATSKPKEAPHAP